MPTRVRFDINHPFHRFRFHRGTPDECAIHQEKPDE
jgi:hypothetical protein